MKESVTDVLLDTFGRLIREYENRTLHGGGEHSSGDAAADASATAACFVQIRLFLEMFERMALTQDDLGRLADIVRYVDFLVDGHPVSEIVSII